MASTGAGHRRCLPYRRYHPRLFERRSLEPFPSRLAPRLHALLRLLLWWPVSAHVAVPHRRQMGTYHPPPAGSHDPHPATGLPLLPARRHLRNVLRPALQLEEVRGLGDGTQESSNQPRPCPRHSLEACHPEPLWLLGNIAVRLHDGRHLHLLPEPLLA